GKREIPIVGTPKKYVKIYTECWQHDSNQRPNIQRVFEDMNDINYRDLVDKNIDYNDISIEFNINMELKENSEISKSLYSTNLLQHYSDSYEETLKELEIISSVITALKITFCDNDQRNNITNESKILSTDLIISNITKKHDVINNNDQKFLYDLNQLFITQFNIHGVSTNNTNFIINHINNYIKDNNKNPNEILTQYYNHQYRYYFTSIIGFFYEYGIGTLIDYFKAFDMYKQASDNSYLSYNNSLIENNLLKENHIIGLISLGISYISGNGVTINHQKALQLFLKSVTKGSSLGKCRIWRFLAYESNRFTCSNAASGLALVSQMALVLALALISKIFSILLPQSISTWDTIN
ncbi:23760_t:CDS:2, partial [Cetraspora pellucida]